MTGTSGNAVRPPNRCGEESLTPASERGIVLVLALWAGTLLAVIAAGLAFGVRTDTSSAINAGARLQAELLADSAVNLALLGLLERNGDGDPAGGWNREMPFEGGWLRASIQAETGKIDINAAPEALIAGLISAAAEGLDGPPADAASVTAALLDWRDSDSQPRPLGAEDSRYQAAGLRRGAGDRAFLSAGELGQVFGMPDGMFERLRTAVTVHTRTAKVDPMAAPELALLAVPGLDPGRVGAFLSARDSPSGDAVALPYGNAGELLHLLSPGARHLARAEARVFTILAEGRTADGLIAYRRTVVEVDRAASPPYRILAWTEEAADRED